MVTRQKLLLCILLALLTLSFHTRLKKQADPDAVREISEEAMRPKLWNGKVAPDVDLPTLDGGRFRIAEHVGRKVIVLNFFATWCGPCRMEMPELQRFHEANPDVLLVGVDVKEDAATVAAYVKELGMRIPVALDSGTVAKAYGVESYPTTVIVGAQGRVRLYETSAIMNAEVALGAFVDAERAEVRKGRGTTAEAWKAAAASEQYWGVRETSSSDSDAPVLTGRAREIASTMMCACGCSNKLVDCSCATATGMKKKLAEGDFGTRTDAEIKTALNAEFCMKGM